MEASEFRLRPVAALVGEVRFGRPPRPGELLELSITIEDDDADAIGYRGRALAGGEVVIELERCVGAQLPLSDFDDPEAVRRRYEQLRSSSCPLSGASAVTPILYARCGTKSATRAEARLVVPPSAPFFADHFPRRPVFPATLLTDALSRLAAELVLSDRAAAPEIRLLRMTNVKLRSFLPPGSVVDLSA